MKYTFISILIIPFVSVTILFSLSTPVFGKTSQFESVDECVMKTFREERDFTRLDGIKNLMEMMKNQIQSVNAVKDASKKVGKLQQNVVGQFIKDIKQNKYDAMDLVRSIKTTPLGDASFSKKEFFLSLFDLIKKRTR